MERKEGRKKEEWMLEGRVTKGRLEGERKESLTIKALEIIDNAVQYVSTEFWTVFFSGQALIMYANTRGFLENSWYILPLDLTIFLLVPLVSSAYGSLSWSIISRFDAPALGFPAPILPIYPETGLVPLVPFFPSPEHASDVWHGTSCMHDIGRCE